MPTFCRHNRFLDRCPICSKTLPDRAPRARPTGAGRTAGASPPGSARTGARPRPQAQGQRVRREHRAADDGYRSELVPGLRASADASRLAQEIGFSSGRLLALAAAPPGLYGELRELAAGDLERATWGCFLIAYLSPAEGEQPFAGIRAALERSPAQGAPAWSAARPPTELPDLDGLPLGPRTSHDPARGSETLLAYLQWVERGGTATGGQSGAGAPAAPVLTPSGPPASQALAFTGDPGWTAERRFERLFERLALPGLTRAARYELLVILGRLGLYELRADALHLRTAVRGVSSEDPATLAAKRLFGIADPLLLERRASALAAAAAVPIDALELALANWGAPTRATLGFPADTDDAAVRERTERALAI
jgi:hypothetical protein